MPLYWSMPNTKYALHNRYRKHNHYTAKFHRYVVINSVSTVVPYGPIYDAKFGIDSSPLWSVKRNEYR